MKIFCKNNLYIFGTLFFVILIFKNNLAFKNCILNGCFLFFEQVFPSLFPMFIINDILINYHFDWLIEKSIHKVLKKVFGFSSIASYIFIMSIFSGTPTNAYMTANLVKEKKLSNQDASIILTYSCFLNPLFLYNILNMIFQNTHITLKLIFINYSLNFLIAFLLRKYPYKKNNLENTNSLNFSKALSKSLKRSIDTLFIILGTIIFYFIICEGLQLFIQSPLLNCLLNGILETTGGLAKLISLQINVHLKEIFVLLFISFGGFSIHTQIKNIILDANISYKYFLVARLFHTFLSALIWIIIS